MHLLFLLLAVTLCVVFFGELAIMFVLSRLLAEDASEWTRLLLDAGLLAALLAVVIVPLMLHIRKRHLRVAHRALRLQFTLDQHAIVSITDVTGRITFANERFCEISGFAREELLGQNHRILKSGVHAPEVFEEMWRTIAGGSTWHGDVCNRNKAGGLYWVHATITPFMNEHGKPEEYIAIRTEITAQKDMEKMSRKQEAWLRTILDNLGEGVYTLDRHGKLDYLNAEAERMIGWRLDELAGKQLHDIIHHHRPDGSPLPANECPIHLAMRDRRVYRCDDEVFYSKDGTPLPVKLTGAPLALEGEWQGSVAVFSDIREQHMLTKQLREARNAAEGATRLKADFLSTMSHEIRTPLNGVIGMTDLLLDTPLDNEQTEFARIIKTSADALLGLINDILDFSKIEAGQMVLEHTDFSLRQIMEGSLDLLAVKAREKGLTLASFIATDLPDHLIGDPTRIRQILLNFISNAIKFTERGEVVAMATGEAAGTGQLVASEASGHGREVVIKLEVRDTGIGLSDSARANLFQPFTQADNSTTRKYGGTGLGLSISKRLVEAMKGEIGVDSVAGAGSSFWVRIPLSSAPEKRARRSPDAVLGGKCVLVVGEGAEKSKLWCTYFEAWRMHCEVVATFAALRRRLAAFEAADSAPDALLLVQPLPDATLAEAVAALQQDGKRLPLICCLAQPDRELKSALAESGAIVVQQPVKQSSLLDAIMSTLQRTTREPQPAQASPCRRRSDAGDRSEGGAPVVSGRHLLLAEDNPVNQRVAVRMLNKLGYAVDVVDNGALAVAAVTNGDYALVLMDCQMPEMDGFHATAAIRRAESESQRRIPVIAMTANVMQGDREQCLAAGMDDYIAKPIDLARLAGLLTAWLPKTEMKGPASTAAPAAAPAAVPPAPTICADAIDMTRLTELFGDDLPVIEEMLGVFEESLRPLRERLKREVRDHGHALKTIAHEIRGAAANVGATPLAELAERLEGISASGNWDEIELIASRIDNEFVRIPDFISRRNEHRNRSSEQQSQEA